MLKRQKGMQISAKAIVALLNKNGLNSKMFFWKSIMYFKSLSPGTLQGFNDDHEPIGPTIRYTIQVLTPSQELAGFSAAD